MKFHTRVLQRRMRSFRNKSHEGDETRDDEACRKTLQHYIILQNVGRKETTRSLLTDERDDHVRVFLLDVGAQWRHFGRDLVVAVRRRQVQARLQLRQAVVQLPLQVFQLYQKVEKLTFCMEIFPNKLIHTGVLVFTWVHCKYKLPPWGFIHSSDSKKIWRLAYRQHISWFVRA